MHATQCLLFVGRTEREITRPTIVLEMNSQITAGCRKLALRGQWAVGRIDQAKPAAQRIKVCRT
jgi:hypothetical protein